MSAVVNRQIHFSVLISCLGKSITHILNVTCCDIVVTGAGNTMMRKVYCFSISDLSFLRFSKNICLNSIFTYQTPIKS